jgi:hypothetical protein
MHMKVRDSLAAVGAVVDDEAETGVGFVDAKIGGNRACCEKEVAKDIPVLRSGFADSRDGLFWNDEDVAGRLWTDILEGETKLVLVNDIGRDFAVDDLLKNAHGLKEERCNRPGVNG